MKVINENEKVYCIKPYKLDNGKIVTTKGKPYTVTKTTIGKVYLIGDKGIELSFPRNNSPRSFRKYFAGKERWKVMKKQPDSGISLKKFRVHIDEIVNKLEMSQVPPTPRETLKLITSLISAMVQSGHPHATRDQIKAFFGNDSRFDIVFDQLQDGLTRYGYKTDPNWEAFSPMFQRLTEDGKTVIHCPLQSILREGKMKFE